MSPVALMDHFLKFLPFPYFECVFDVQNMSDRHLLWFLSLICISELWNFTNIWSRSLCCVCAHKYLEIYWLSQIIACWWTFGWNFEVQSKCPIWPRMHFYFAIDLSMEILASRNTNYSGFHSGEIRGSCSLCCRSKES